MKRSYIFSLALLVSIAGCGKSKKKAGVKKSDKNTEVFSEVNIPVADDGISSFFDQDVGEFVLADEAEKVAASGTTGNELDVDGTDNYSWLEQGNEFKKIYFAFDDFSVRDDQEEPLAYDINRIKGRFEPGKEETWPTIYVDGHSCHAAGSKAYNLALSERRAKVIQERLLAVGIPASSIKIVARGSEVPARDKQGNSIEGDRAQQWPNRRDEIRIS